MKNIRSLCPVEQVLWKLDRAGSMNFTVVAELDSSLDPEALRSALNIETSHYPRLGARIEYTEGSTPIIEFDPPIPMPLRIVERKSDDTWRRELEFELNQPIDWSTGPLARATLVLGSRASELLFTLHHAIGDATSGILLARNILKRISSHNFLNPPLGRIAGKTASIEHSVGLDQTKPTFRLRTLRFGVRQLLFSKIHRPEKLAADVYAAPSARNTRVIHKRLTTETTSLLRSTAKECGTTVHGALCVAMMVAAYIDIQSHKLKRRGGSMWLACMSPVDMRKYCPEPATEDIGFYVSTTVADGRVDPKTPFWSLAGGIAASIHRNIGAGEPLMSLALQSRALPSTLSPNKLASRVEGMIAAAVGVTNVGMVDSEKFGKDLYPRSIHYAAAVNAIAGTGFLCSAVTFRDQLTLNFLYASPLLSDERAERLADLVVKALVSATRKHLTVAELAST